jgi:antitoxin HicB
MYYYADIKKEDDVFVVSFPDFPNINTFGETFDSAIIMAHEALNLTLGYDSERGFSLPERTEIEDGIKIKVEENIHLSSLFRSLRGKRPQSEIAKKLGISYQAYQKLENPDKCNPTIRTLEKLASVFDNEVYIDFVRTP